MVRDAKTKIIATLMLTIMIISNIIQLFPLLESNATSVGDTKFIESIGTVPYHLKSRATHSGGYVKTDLAGYKDNGKFYPAYCLDSELHGADSNSGYNVNLTELIKDTDTYNKVWRTTIAGYPYHTPEELGVSDWVYAYQATKMAIYCVTGQARFSDFYADDSIGQQIIGLIQKLVNEGNNGTATYKTPVAEISKVDDVVLEGEYYTQKYNLTTNLDISDFTLAISGFPKGTILTDVNGNVKDTFSAGEQFQVKMPKEQFEVQNINGKIRATVKTKEYAIFYGKTYDAQRQNYAITADPISLTSCSTDLSIKNNKSTIKIYKYNEDKSAPIQGVTFELLKEDGTVVKTVKTDENGIATFENLFKGKYYAREKGTVKGYLLNDEKLEISVEYDSTSEATMTNKEPTGEIKLIKTDIETGNQDRVDKTSHHGDATLDGTVYTIYAGEDIYNVANTVKYFSKDEEIGTYTFDSYGMAVVKITNTLTPAKLESDGNVLKGLPMGSYYAKETTVPQGYLKDENTHLFELKYKDEHTEIIKIENTLTNEVQKGRFEVIKMSSDTNTTAPVVDGAEFTAILTKYVNYYGSFDEALKHLNEFAQNEYSIFKTEANGHGISGLLAYGQYTVNETYCPSDKINPVKEFYANIDKNSDSPIKELIENDTPFTSYVKMIKLDKKTGKKVTLSNATFSLYKLNETNNQWEKVSCKLGKESFDSWTTDENAIAYTETKLEAGKYKVDEIKTPEGFLQLDEEYTFEISRSNETVEYDEDMDAYITVEVKNEQPTGTLNVDKSIAIRNDIDTSIFGINDLSKIEFKLIAKKDILDMADGSVIYKAGQEVKTFNVDKDGKYTLSELPMGEYQLQETKTLDGLVLDETIYDVIFNQKDLTTKVYSENKAIENKTTVIEISKTDITGDKELVGAKLTVTDENNEVIDSWVSTERTHKIEGLEVGKEYTLTEEITPDEFVKSASIKFTVENTADVQKVVMIDKRVSVKKTDLVTGDELEGAELEVTDKDGNVIDSWTSGKEEHYVKDLVEGETYTLTEKTCPYGYEIAESIEFTVSEDKETQLVEMKDKPIFKAVRVEKLDKDTKEHIKSNKFTFGIYEDEACTKLIKEAGANESEGTALFEELRYGTYYIKEMKAPVGYKLSDQIVKIEINDKGVFADGKSLEEKNGVYSFEYYNSLLPKIQTGNETNYILLGILIGISLIGIIGGIKVLKGKHNEK